MRGLLRKVGRGKQAVQRFWRDRRGLAVTPEAGVWLVIGLGTATLVTFALSGGIRGLAARVLTAINGVNPGL